MNTVLSLPTLAFGIDVQNYGDESELIYMIDLAELDPSLTDEALITRKLGKGPFKIVKIIDTTSEKIVSLEKF